MVQGNISCLKSGNHDSHAGNRNCAVSLFCMLYFLIVACYYDFALCHPFLDCLVEGELGWFCFGLVWVFQLHTGFSALKICSHLCLASSSTLCHTKGAAVFQGIPFNFLAAVLAGHYQKPPQP